MSADRHSPREIRFTRAAANDLRALKLSVSDLKTVTRRLRDIAALERVTDDRYVCRIAQTDYEWFRLKLANIRPSARLAFSIEEDGDVLLVRFVGARNAKTYDLIEALWALVEAA